MAFDVHEISYSDHDFLDLLSEFASGCEDESLASLKVGIYLLETRDGKGCGFASSRLSLRNDVATFWDVSLADDISLVYD